MSTVTGTRLLLGLTLRRERLRGSAWYGLTALVLLSVAAGIVATYPTAADREQLATSVDASAGELFIIGPLLSTGIGGVGQWRILGVATIVVSLASLFTVMRNTRTPEENGTSEMLGSAAVGRAAPLASALCVSSLGSLAAGMIVGAGFLGLSGSLTGSLLVGAQIAMLGLLAASLAALTGQIVQTSRGSTAIAVACIAVFFLLRGAADTIGGNAYWMSPFGWIAAVRPFADNNALMLLLPLALTVLLMVVALTIASRRDLGAGVFPERAGPAHASPALRGPTSLALRTSRAPTIGWAVGALIVGLLIGAVASTVDSQLKLTLGSGAGSGSGLTQTALYLSPLFATILGLQLTLQLRAEITSGRAETVLASRVARSRWLLAYVIAGSVGAVAVMVAFGVGLASASLATDPRSFGTLAVSGLLRVPAPGVFIALTALLLATLPRAAAAIAFSAVGLVQALEFAVEFRLLPKEALYASPFALVPQMPDGDAHVWQTTLLILLAAALTTTAARTIRRHDIH